MDFTKVFEDAEKQVAGIKNEKLREIAFDKLVTYILDGQTSDGNKKSEPTIKKKKATARASATSKTRTDGPKAWIQELVGEGFFGKPKSSAEIREELETRSHHLSATDLTSPLQALCHDKKLRRKKIALEGGGKAVLHWVNW